jgi:hypothetical protein
MQARWDRGALACLVPPISSSGSSPISSGSSEEDVAVALAGPGGPAKA